MSSTSPAPSESPAQRRPVRPRLSRRTRLALGRLALLWLALGVVRALGTLVVKHPIIFIDELNYTRFAVAIGRGEFWGHPGSALGGFPFLLYPLVISPFFALSAEHGYTLAKVFSAFLISSACFPVYLLARRLLPGRWSFALAALSLLLPGMVGYSNLMMAESLYYPLTLWLVALALGWVLSGGRGSALGVGVVGGLLLLTKVQAVVTLTVLALTPVLALTHRPWRERLGWVGRFCAVAAVVVALFALHNVVRMGPAALSLDKTVWLGLYSGLTSTARQLEPLTLARSWVGYLVALPSELAPGLGVFSLACTLVLVVAPRRPRERVLGVSLALLILVHAWLAVRQTVYFDDPARIHTRYLTQLVPLLMLAVALVLRRRHFPARALAVGSALVGLGALLWVAPRLGGYANTSDTPGLGWTLLLERVLHVGPAWLVDERGASLRMWVVGLSALVTLALLLALRRMRWLVPLTALTLLCSSAALAVAQRRMYRVQQHPTEDVRPLARRLWESGRPVHYYVDGMDVMRYWQASAATAGDGEAFCVQRRDVPCKPVQPDATGRLLAVEQAAQGGFLIAPHGVALTAPVHQTLGNSWVVYRVEGPLHLRGSIEGQFPDGWLGPSSRVHWRGQPRTIKLALSLAGAPSDLPPRKVEVHGGPQVVRLTVAPGQQQTLELTPASCEPDCKLDIRTEAWVPHAVMSNGDMRELGLRMDAITW